MRRRTSEAPSLVLCRGELLTARLCAFCLDKRADSAVCPLGGVLEEGRVQLQQLRLWTRVDSSVNTDEKMIAYMIEIEK